MAKARGLFSAALCDKRDVFGRAPRVFTAKAQGGLTFHPLLDEPPDNNRADHFSANTHHHIWHCELGVSNEARPVEKGCCIKGRGNG